jgi:predicted TIM-barrel fold metal-dependent hydrolase
MKESGIEKAVVLNTVTNERQVKNVNAFALETDKNYDNLIPFCSVHPLTPDIKDILTELKNAGIKGIKHHPDYVGIEIDDERTNNLLSGASELGMPVVIHAGFDPVSPNKMHASPDAIVRVCEKFPELKLVVAHLGGVLKWNEVFEKLCGKNVYFDTAFCCERVGLDVETAKKIFSKHPHEKILFGSDAPWAKPLEILDFLNKLGLSDESLELILHKNTERLLEL